MGKGIEPFLSCSLIKDHFSFFRPHLAAMSNLPASVKTANVQTEDHNIIYKHLDTHSRLTDAVWTDDSTLVTIGHGRKMVTHSLK